MSATAKYRLLLKNAVQLVAVCAEGELLKRGPQQKEISIISDGALVVGLDGKILAVGTSIDLLSKFDEKDFERVVDARNKCVVPGFVDGHTHPVWAGDRVHEFAMKLEGATYMDIHKMGGGIGFTVNHTKNASEDELERLFRTRLDRMLKLGTTVAEAKSGYGLELDTELKMLRVIHKVSGKHAVDIVSNYCGAHSVPKGSTAAEATKDIVERQIPAIATQIKEGQISPTLIDVFCEKNVFEFTDTVQIVEAGKTIGLEVNFHGDELSYIKGGELAGQVGALAMSHCEETSDEGIMAMAQRPTFATLLPTTAYLLRLKYPRARKMIECNVPIALGSDFNPNAHCMSMPFVMNLACVNMGMTMPEALVAATINSAASLGVSDRFGSLEVGKSGDCVVIDAPSWEHIIYQLIDSPIAAVIKSGVVHSKS